MFGVSAALIGTGLAAAALAAHGAQRRRAEMTPPHPCSEPWLESLGMQAFCSAASTGGPVGLFLPSGFDKTKPFQLLMVLHDQDKERGIKNLLHNVEWTSKGPYKDKNGLQRPATNRGVLLPLRGDRPVASWMMPPDDARLLVQDAALALLNKDVPLPIILTGLGPAGATAAKNALHTGFVPDAVQYLNPDDSQS